MFKIFIIEDDKTISGILKENLIKWGYDTYEANDFKNVFAEYGKNHPHLVLMDITLPYYDGFYWCEMIRRSSNVPIIFISSRNDDKDKIRAITGGADDYVEKPFSIDFMVAKIQAVLRRAYSYADNANNILTYKDIAMDTEKAQVALEGRIVQLTRNEALIFSLLIKVSGKTVPRSSIIKSLWEDEQFVDENTLTVNVNRLRKKLKELKEDEIIATVKKEGYRLI